MYAIPVYFLDPTLQTAALKIEPDSISQTIIKQFLAKSSNETVYEDLLTIHNLLKNSGYIADLTEGMKKSPSQVTEALINQLPPADLLDAQEMHNEYTRNQQVIDKIMKLMDLINPADIPLEMAARIIAALLQRNETLAENSELRFSETALINESARISKNILASARPDDTENASNLGSTLFERVYENRIANKLSLTAFMEYKAKIKNFLSQHERTKTENGPTLNTRRSR